MTKKVKVNARNKAGGGIIADSKDMTVRHYRRDVARALRVKPQKQQPKPEGFG